MTPSGDMPDEAAQQERFSLANIVPQTPELNRGIWERIERRVQASSEPEVAVQCELALKALQNLDNDAAMAILRGERCITLWPRDPNEDKD